MKRRDFLLAGLSAATLVSSAAAAFAVSYAEDVVNQLARLGFSDITVQTTLLGRIKILATRSDGMREIVLNPRTGEILRDVWFASGGGNVRRVLDDVSDDDNDDDGDDNSGSGGGDDDKNDDDNSGPGGGGDDGGDDNSGPGGGDDDRDDRDDRRDD
jgi:hypothetical protein